MRRREGEIGERVRGDGEGIGGANFEGGEEFGRRKLWWWWWWLWLGVGEFLAFEKVPWVSLWWGVVVVGGF